MEAVKLVLNQRRLEPGHKFAVLSIVETIATFDVFALREWRTCPPEKLLGCVCGLHEYIYTNAWRIFKH